MSSPKVLICEPNEEWANRLKSEAERLGLTVVGVVSEADKVLALAMERKPEILIVAMFAPSVLYPFLFSI